MIRLDNDNEIDSTNELNEVVHPSLNKNHDRILEDVESIKKVSPEDDDDLFDNHLQDIENLKNMKIKEMKKILDLKSEKEKCKSEIMQLKMDVEKEKTLLTTLRKQKSGLFSENSKVFKSKKKNNKRQNQEIDTKYPNKSFVSTGIAKPQNHFEVNHCKNHRQYESISPPLPAGPYQFMQPEHFPPTYTTYGHKNIPGWYAPIAPQTGMTWTGGWTR